MWKRAICLKKRYTTINVPKNQAKQVAHYEMI